MSKKVFLSYRRKDSPGFVGRISDRLASEFGHDNVFLDIEQIVPGTNWLDIIIEQIIDSDVFLVIIGPRWLIEKNDDGLRKIDLADDVARIEIECAIERDIKIIPVLLDDTNMPDMNELPLSIQPILSRHAQRIRNQSIDENIERLISAINNKSIEGRKIRNIHTYIEFMKSHITSSESYKKFEKHVLYDFSVNNIFSGIKYFISLMAFLLFISFFIFSFLDKTETWLNLFKLDTISMIVTLICVVFLFEMFFRIVFFLISLDNAIETVFYLFVGLPFLWYCIGWLLMLIIEFPFLILDFMGIKLYNYAVVKYLFDALNYNVHLTALIMPIIAILMFQFFVWLGDILAAMRRGKNE